METNHGGGAARGLVLLIGGAPGGRRRQPVRPEAALGLLATLPPEALLGSPIPASVLQLADPGDPQLLLAHLQTAARTPGPVLVALVGQLTADRRRRELHLALAQTTRDNVRYTALPWAWLADQLRQRPLGSTTVLADLVADPDAWSVVEQRGPEALTAGLPLMGQVSPPGTIGDGYAPPYTRALVDQLSRAERGTRPADLHHLAGHSGLPPEALLLSGVVPIPPGATGQPLTAPAPAFLSAPSEMPTPMPVQAAGGLGGGTGGVAPAPSGAAPAVPPVTSALPAVPGVAAPAVAVPGVAVPAPAVPGPAVPAPGSPDPGVRIAVTELPGEAAAAGPPAARADDVTDPRPGIAAALHGGDVPRAAYLIADWERLLLRHQGPRAPQLADVAEAQAQLALAAGDLARATERLIEAARLRLRQLPPHSPQVSQAVDNAVAIWGRLPRDVALRQGAALLTLCRALPAGGGRVSDVELRMARLTERTGLLRRAR